MYKVNITVIFGCQRPVIARLPGNHHSWTGQLRNPSKKITDYATYCYRQISAVGGRCRIRLYNQKAKCEPATLAGECYDVRALPLLIKTSSADQKATYKQNRTRIQVRDSRPVLLILYFLNGLLRSLSSKRAPPRRNRRISKTGQESKCGILIRSYLYSGF